jgi:hypothetical protein
MIRTRISQSFQLELPSITRTDVAMDGPGTAVFMLGQKERL